MKLAPIFFAAVFLHCLAAFAEEPPVRVVPGAPLEQRELKDSLGRTITYYVNHPRKPAAPILLMIQGSGCAPVMNVEPKGTFSTLFNLLPFADDGEFTVVSVEKPFASGKPSGTAVNCSAEFNKDFTAERWLVALSAVLDDARKLPWVDKSRTLVFGFSEGAVMAGLLAGGDDRVTDVISMSGSGTTQLFDFVTFCYQQAFDKTACLADIDKNVAAINANPDSSTEFAWGHPYKRWSSFFRAYAGNELLKSKARVYMAFGTADQSVPALSEELAVAQLRVAGRDLTVRRIPGAGHSLSDNPQSPYEDLDREYRTALKWFWSHAKD